MIINTRGFLFNLLEDDEIDEKPACYKHAPSIHGLDYLIPARFNYQICKRKKNL